MYFSIVISPIIPKKIAKWLTIILNNDVTVSGWFCVWAGNNDSFCWALLLHRLSHSEDK